MLHVMLWIYAAVQPLLLSISIITQQARKEKKSIPDEMVLGVAIGDVVVVCTGLRSIQTPWQTSVEDIFNTV